jgi:hypothetical protein
VTARALLRHAAPCAIAALSLGALSLPASAVAGQSHGGGQAHGAGQAHGRGHAAKVRCFVKRHRARTRAGHRQSCPRHAAGSFRGHSGVHGYSGGGRLEATPLGPSGSLAGGELIVQGPSSAGARGTGAGSSGKPPAKPPLPLDSGEVVTDPIDPRFLTYLPFGTRSFWLQPWRAYFDTWPASRLLEAVGINFNVKPEQAEATAQLLQDSGFKLARIGIDWSALSYEDPTTFQPANLWRIAARLTALHRHGLRPLVVLDAYSGAPTPAKHFTLETTAATPAGASAVTLTAAGAAEVVPGKTGFNGLTFKGAPDILITSVSASGVATLSRPLPHELPAGPHPATTLLYAPFQSPKLSNGEPNPEFQATLKGWLNYVAQVCKEAASIVGPEGFDLEIWNELTFESQFLNAENYYAEGALQTSARAATAAGATSTTGAISRTGATSSAGATSSTGGGEPQSGEVDYSSSEAGLEGDYSRESTPEPEEGEEGSGEAEAGEAEAVEAEAGEAEAVGALTVKSHKREVSKEIRKALLRATVEYVRDPANGISPSVGITDGFASQTPFPSGAAAPLGLTALSKHPYVGPRSFPSEYFEDHVIPLNAMGLSDKSSKTSFQPQFVPDYQSLLPEYTLAGVSTETLIRDLAPFTNDVYHFPHGRYVGPPGGAPVQKWVTEYNLAPGKATVVGPDEVTPQTGAAATLSSADKAHFQAKALLRSLVAMVNKGMSREYFFAAAPGALGMIDEGFFKAVEAQPETYPGDARGGETMDGFRRLLARFQGPGPEGQARQLQLLSIAQEGDHAQFAGDGTPAHPSLYDRDALAVLPFQASSTRFVIPVYVMTRDLLTLYRPEASPSDVTRFDLPAESFRITLGNLPEGGGAPTVSAYDPLRDEATPARLLSREGTTATFEIAATDYPRLLELDY